MNLKISYLISVALLLTACWGGNKETAAEEKPLIAIDEAIDIETQSVFDQSQMTNKLSALCVKFKTLEGHDRIAVFNLFEKVLPSCPYTTMDKENKADHLNASQVMSLYDLKELLGEPTEIRNDGMFVYNLAADGSYKVLFMPEANGSVACRSYEGDS